MNLRTLQSLYSRPLPSSRSGALFNAFSYPTKISPEVVALYIACHTDVGATVADAFAGSGTTGLAALLCDRPTAYMKDLANKYELTPTWGPRAAILYEIGALGAFVADQLCHPAESNAFVAAANSILSDVELELPHVYEASSSEGEPGVLRHVVWSEVLICPCGREISYWDAVVRTAPLHFQRSFRCPGCGRHSSPEALDRQVETVPDGLTGTSTVRRVRVPARVFGRSGRKSWQRPPNSGDLATIASSDAAPFPTGTPVVKMQWGDLHRAGYHLGMTHVHHLYTRRNFLVMAHLLARIERTPAPLRDTLRLWALSYNSSHSTLMTRVVAKTGQKDLVITGAQPGVLYVSGLPVEKNIIAGLRRKIDTFANAFALVHGSRSTVRVVRGDCSRMDIPDHSVDYIFTDPPFADFIPYSEINQVNELWLGSRTNTEREMIVSPAQGKDLSHYGQLMTAAFREMHRVLRPQGVATVIFHAAKAAVWRTLQEVVTEARFSLLMTSILEKLQGSFKQVSSQATVQGDPILLLAPAREQHVEGPVSCMEPSMILKELMALLENSSDEPRERTPERLYGRYVAYCLQRRIPVALDATAFYGLIKESELALAL